MSPDMDRCPPGGANSPLVENHGPGLEPVGDLSGLTPHIHALDTQLSLYSFQATCRQAGSLQLTANQMTTLTGDPG